MPLPPMEDPGNRSYVCPKGCSETNLIDSDRAAQFRLNPTPTATVKCPICSREMITLAELAKLQHRPQQGNVSNRQDF